MQPSSDERAPPWSWPHNRSRTGSPWTTRVFIIITPCLLLIIASIFIFIYSTRTPKTSALVSVDQQKEIPLLFKDDTQLRRYKKELREMTLRLQRQLKVLRVQSEVRKKRDSSDISTSHKSTVSNLHTTTHTSIPNATILSNISTTIGKTSEWHTIAALVSNTNISSNLTSHYITNTPVSVHSTQRSQENLTSIYSDSVATTSKMPLNSVADTNDIPHSIKDIFGPLQNGSHCVQFTEEQLVKELKQHGTYNPDFMAWDVRGVLNFFERASTDNYDRLKKSQDRSMSVEQNLAAVEQLVKELNLQNCNLRTPDVLARLYNLSSTIPTRGATNSDTFNDYDRLRTKRDEATNQEHTNPSLLAKAKYIYDLYKYGEARDDSLDTKSRSGYPWKTSSDNDGIIGQVHVVPSGCRKRGSSEDGYLRLCSACQAIRRLPDTFFPPFLNEVTCDEDKACLYFYDYPHGKCRQKHLNLVVLKNLGTSDCQLWKRYNLNVRVSCECFVDEMSFFAKYV